MGYQRRKLRAWLYQIRDHNRLHPGTMGGTDAVGRIFYGITARGEDAQRFTGFQVNFRVWFAVGNHIAAYDGVEIGQKPYTFHFFSYHFFPGGGGKPNPVTVFQKEIKQLVYPGLYVNPVFGNLCLKDFLSHSPVFMVGKIFSINPQE